MIRFYLFFLLGIFMVAPGNAQSSLTVDTLQARQWVIRADSLDGMSDYDSAITYYQKAAHVYQQHALWAYYVDCLNDITWGYRRLYKNSRAKRHARQALRESRAKLEENSEGQATAYRYLGLIYRDEGDYDLAIRYYQKARQMHSSSGRSRLATQLYNDIGTLFFKKGQYDTARMYHYKALHIQEKTAADSLEVSTTYAYLGDTYQQLDSYDSALLYYFRGLTIVERELGTQNADATTFYNNIGTLYSTRGDYENALHYLRKSATVDEQISGDSPYLAISLYNIGAMYTTMGGYHNALDYYRKSLAIDQQYYDDSHQQLAIDYYGLAYVYEKMQNYPLSLFWLEKVVAINEKTLPPIHLKVAEGYAAIGECYRAEGKFEDALRYLYRSIEVYEALQENNPSLFYPYETLGNIYRDLLDYEHALTYYQKAIAVGQKRWTGKHPDLASCYNTVADFYRKQNNLDSALRNYHYAMKANMIDTRRSRFTYSQNYLSPLPLLASYIGKAEIRERRFEQTHRPSDLHQAWADYQRGDTLIQQIRRTLQYANDRIALGEKSLRVYEGGLRVSLALAEATDEPARSHAYLAQAFRWAEKSRGGALALALADTQAKHVAGVPDSLLAQDRDLRVRQAYYRTQLTEPQALDSEQVVQVEDQLFVLSRQHEALIERLEQEYPRYYALKYQPTERSLAEVQASLDDETALLEYLVGDSTVYVFTVTAQGSKVVSLANDSTLQTSLTTLRSVLDKTATLSPDEAQHTLHREASRLYQRLVAPALESVNPSVQTLLIVPDGLLSYLPFEVLLTQPVDDRNADQRALPYLLRKYRISYTYSAALQSTFPTFSPRPASPRYVAFAPSYTANSKKGRGDEVPLAWNQSEVAQIGHYLKGNSRMGRQATEAQFKREASQYDILHLATHAFPDAEEPMQARLVFAAPPTATNDSSGTEDGMLYAYELYAMELPTQLAVLSACHTGNGTWARGEGMMSLARAFIYAGCQSLVLNRWSAEDASTAQLMNNFYRYLAQGLPKHEALQRAKLDFLDQASPVYAHPFYWGGFVLVGDPAPIVYPRLNTGFSWLIVSVIILVGGLTTAILLRQRAKRKLAKLAVLSE